MSTGPIQGTRLRRRLRPCARCNRRCHTTGLRGGCGGRTAGHSDWLPEPGCGLVQRPGRGMPPSDVGSRTRLPLTQLCQGLQSPWSQAHPHRALHAPAPTARPNTLSISVRNGPTECLSRTPRNATTGCRITSRSITGSGSTRPSAADPLSSDSTSCSADQGG
jgi:hypothetical protein